MDSGIGKIPIHPFDLGQIFTSAYRTNIHFQLLMTTIVTISQRKIDSLIKAHIHCPADQGLDRFGIVINGIFHILDLSTIRIFPKTIFQIFRQVSLFQPKPEIILKKATQYAPSILQPMPSFRKQRKRYCP